MIEAIAAFSFGSILGSFFHTLALRFVDGAIESNPIKALFSRSVCQMCGEKIKPLYLVPLFGYLLLRGRCSSCSGRISLSYPVSEILYGLVSLAVVLKFGAGIYQATLALMLFVSISISYIDFKKMIIPDSLVLLFAVFSIYHIILNGSLSDNFFGLLFMALFFAVILLIFPGAFGIGDLKYAAAVGLACGLELSIVALEFSLISGAVAGIAYAIKSGKGLRTKMPFGPFIAAGLFASIFFGADILLVWFRFIY